MPTSGLIDVTLGKTLAANEKLNNAKLMQVFNGSTFRSQADSIGVRELVAAISGNNIDAVSDYGAQADGATDDRTALFNADAAATAAGGCLVLAPGTYLVASNLTFTACVQFLPGAKLKPQSGSVTVTHNNDIVAGFYQIYDISGAGLVRWGQGMQTRPNIMWLGAVADWNGSTGTDNQAAIQEAVDACGGLGRSLYVPPGDYKVSDEIELLSAGVTHGNYEIEGEYIDARFSQVTASGRGSTLVADPAVDWTGKAVLKTGNGRNVTISKLKVIGDGYTVAGHLNHAGIRSESYHQGLRIVNCMVTNCYAGLDFGYGGPDAQGDFNFIYDTTVSDCRSGMRWNNTQNFVSTALNCHVVNCLWAYNSQEAGSVNPPVRVIGGFASARPKYGRGIWKTAVSSIAVSPTNTVTVSASVTHYEPDDMDGSGVSTDNSSAVADMDVLCLCNVKDNLPYEYCALSELTSEAANVLTLTGGNFGGVVTTAVAGGDCYYGDFATVFRGQKFTVDGVHIESASDQNFLASLTRSHGAVIDMDVRNCRVILDSNNTDFVRSRPLVYSASSGTNMQRVNLTKNEIVAFGAKVMADVDVLTLDSNHWNNEPALRDSGSTRALYGYRRHTETHNYRHSSKSGAGSDPGGTNDIGPGGAGRLGSYAEPERRFAHHLRTAPTSGPVDEITFDGTTANDNHVGWRQRNRTQDGITGATIATTADSVAGEYKLTNVGSLTNIVEDTVITVATAYPTGTKVTYVDSMNDVVWVSTASAGNVTGGSVAHVAAEIATWGRQHNFGTAAPVSGTWCKADITWNTNPSAGVPAYWICSVAGTPGTWVASANLV